MPKKVRSAKIETFLFINRSKIMSHTINNNHINTYYNFSEQNKEKHLNKCNGPDLKASLYDVFNFYLKDSRSRQFENSDLEAWKDVISNIKHKKDKSIVFRFLFYITFGNYFIKKINLEIINRKPIQNVLRKLPKEYKTEKLTSKNEAVNRFKAGKMNLDTIYYWHDYGDLSTLTMMQLYPAKNTYLSWKISSNQTDIKKNSKENIEIEIEAKCFRYRPCLYRPNLNSEDPSNLGRSTDHIFIQNYNYFRPSINLGFKGYSLNSSEESIVDKDEVYYLKICTKNGELRVYPNLVEDFNQLVEIHKKAFNAIVEKHNKSPKNELMNQCFELNKNGDLIYVADLSTAESLLSLAEEGQFKLWADDKLNVYKIEVEHYRNIVYRNIKTQIHNIDEIKKQIE